jgi:hypothetical protein
MLLHEMIPGRRVRAIRDLSVFPHGVIPAGAIGTVCEVTGQEDIDTVVAIVRLDISLEWLAAWNHELYVYGEQWDIDTVVSDVVPSAFEQVED